MSFLNDVLPMSIKEIDSPVFIIDEEGKFLFINEVCNNLFGYQSSELDNKKIYSIIHRDSIAVFKSLLNDFVLKKITNIQYELKIRMKNGSDTELLVNSVVINENGSGARIISFIQDDAVLRNVKKELSRKIREIESFINNIPDMAWVKDSNSRFITANKSFADVVGMSPEDLVGHTCAICFGEEGAKKFKEDDQRVMRQKKQQRIEEKICDAQGNEKWLETIKSPIFDTTDNVIGTVGIARDISDRKKMELELEEHRDNLDTLVQKRTDELAQTNVRLLSEIKKREEVESSLILSKERYSLATKAAKVGVWDWNIESGGFYLDANVKSILGYNDIEIPNDLEVWVNYIHPDDKNAVMEAAQKHIDGITDEYVNEHRMLHKDGSIRWILVRGHVLKDKTGKPVRMVGTDTDITDYKTAKEALNKSQEQYESLFNSIQEGIGIVDANEIIALCNPAFVEIFEVQSMEEIIGKSLLDYIPEDKKNILTQQSDMRRKNICSSYDIDIVTAKNNMKTLHVSVYPRFDGKNNYTGAFGSVIDITERVQAQKDLKKTNDELEDRVNIRTRQLAEANKQLDIERESLEQKNIALKEILDHIGDEKKQAISRIQANIDRIARPLLSYLEIKIDEEGQPLVEIFKDSLREITSPFLNNLESNCPGLTRKEIEICNLIKNGLSTTEIAELLKRSKHTIIKQRKTIRKKLGINNKEVNLATYLKKLKF